MNSEALQTSKPPGLPAAFLPGDASTSSEPALKERSVRSGIRFRVEVLGFGGRV